MDPDPGWSAQVPPWFGSLGYFLGFGITGLVIAAVGALLARALALALHSLGKCILWPTLRACDDTDERTDTAADTDTPPNPPDGAA